MSEWKQKRASELTEQVKKSNVVGILTVRNLPTKQLQQIRTKLPATIIMATKNLMLRALEESKRKGIKDLEQYVTDQPAFIFADENPFRLTAIIKKSRSPAPAKAGDIAPNDIVIEQGPTSFMPGPVLGELKGVGIPCKIDGGKIVIEKTKTIRKAGEEIDAKLAEILGRLGVEPMEIGLDLLACFENGSVFPGDVLQIDEQEYFDNFVKAYRHTLNLSVEAAFPTKTNIETLLQKCYTSSKGLSVEAGILNSATVGEILGKASRAASAISGMVKDAPAEKPAEGKKEEKPAEEKKAEEAKPEEKKEEAPAEENPAEEKPAEEKPAEEKPAEESAEGKPAEAPTGEKAEEKTDTPPSQSPPEGEKQDAEEAAPSEAPSGETQPEPQQEAKEE